MADGNSDDDEVAALLDQCGGSFCQGWADAEPEPVVPEVRLLRHLWRAADEGERAVLARAMQRAFGRDQEAW